MSIKNMKLSKGKKELSKYDIIKIIVFVILLLSIPSLKYIFPNSIFIKKYFTGGYAVLWFLLLIIAALIHDFVTPRKKP